MAIKHRAISGEEELKHFIRSGQPSLYCSSKTSTVIDFSNLKGLLNRDQDLCIVDLSGQAKNLHMMQNGSLRVRGSVTWEEANDFVMNRQRSLKTVPSEPLACVVAGCATSASGERGFSFGGFRDHMVRLSYLDYQGREVKLSGRTNLKDHAWFQADDARNLLAAYQRDYAPFRKFKNGPVPRLERESDLLTGSEGQLGVVVEVIFETTPLIDQVYLMLQLPPWEKESSVHMALFEAVQFFRDCIFSCEFIDHNSVEMANPSGRFSKGSDLIFLQLDARALEHVVTDLLAPLHNIDQDQIFQVKESDFLALRTEVPRRIAEKNRANKIIKKGTDIQVTPEHFSVLWERYRRATELGIPYRLFGHFGDAHLHFNFLPQMHQVNACDDFLDQLYADVRNWGGTPSAEHGIGLVKQARIDPFLTRPQRDMFAFLKAKMDPRAQFFPQGFMSTARKLPPRQ